MGHIRLGRPPATRQWREVVDFLTAGEVDIADLADAVARASDKSLKQAIKDPAFVEALWLLVKIPQAAKSGDFAAALATIGIAVPASPSITDLVAGFDAAVEAVQRRSPNTTDLSAMARSAGIAALHSLAFERVPSLWEPSREDERTTIATFASPERFGELAQRFFSNLVERHLHYYLDRELPRHIGPGRDIRSVNDLITLEGVVRRHCVETTFIMRAFAKDWLGKNAFHLGKDLSRKDAVGFAYVAFEKVRKELAIRSGNHA
ncbi:hypothetical protein [Mesorhizobium sp. L-8-3]|uniref:hypothetical protein n=1 Tax=Mesorhizobium sp. L-8-3 TaxID=2744522 RepID=UPI001926E8A1|nr:hypothetical protein [Mesorhizobium sp. L-8-3]BCH23559.1 hypothetical protein MesoLjLb_33440 [Mesorhizobium sp. L-8-3]